MAKDQPQEQRFQGLRVRRHERRECATPAEVLVASSSAEQLTLSRAAIGPSGGVDARIVDFSGGGLGLSSPVYFPRGCALLVRIVPGEREEGRPVEITARVKRARMSDKTPSYYIGLSFDASGDQREAFLEAVRARAESVAAA